MAGEYKLPFAALVFDVGGIFIRHDNEQLFRRLAASCRAPDALTRIRVAASNPRLTTGEHLIAELYRELVRDLDYRRDWQGFVADWSSHFAVDHGMIELLASLARDHRVMLFSNTNREHWDHVTKLAGGALGSYIAYLSHEISDRKPLPSAFRLMAKRAGIDPARSLFVDDLAENVAGAESIGFRGHVFIDQPTFERFLASL